jgi:hypothetical protein
MAPQVGLDYLDIAPLHRDWFNKLHLTMFTFDLRYGSRTIWGDDALLESVPQFAPADIPMWEGYQLLLNRIAGLLIGLKPHLLVSQDWPEEDSRFLVNQMCKAGMAIGDFRLLSLGDYCSSYQQRLHRLASLQRGLEISAAEMVLLERAYRFKLAPDYGSFPARGFLYELLPQLEAFFISATRRLIAPTVREMNGVTDAVSQWEHQYANILGAEMAALRASMVLLCFSIQKKDSLPDAAMLREAASRFPGVSGKESGIDLYSELRTLLIQKWEEKCH